MATASQPIGLAGPGPLLDLGGRDADRLHRLSAEQYRGIVESGVFGDRARLLLLDGLLVDGMTRGNAHTTAILLVLDAVRAALPAGWHPRTEAPLLLAEGPAGYPSVPEPDLTVARGLPRDYRNRTPEPADIGLAVEVADSSLQEDRRMMARYAFAGIAVAWIVNLADRVVEIHGDPTGPAEAPHYRDTRTFGEAEEIPIMLEGREVGRVAVRDLLP